MELVLQRQCLVAHLARQLVVLAGQLDQLDQVARLLLQALPGLGLIAVLGGLASPAASGRRVIPDARFRELLL
jgi:hypothetical protein